MLRIAPTGEVLGTTVEGLDLSHSIRTPVWRLQNARRAIQQQSKSHFRGTFLLYGLGDEPRMDLDEHRHAHVLQVPVDVGADVAEAHPAPGAMEPLVVRQQHPHGAAGEELHRVEPQDHAAGRLPLQEDEGELLCLSWYHHHLSRVGTFAGSSPIP